MPVLSDIQLRLQRHEQWLIGLRQDPHMTTAKIRTELENRKDLKATSSQLETYFRHLGQRKNLSRHEWIAVFRALDSQKRLGHHFDLYISGKLITEPELKKKRKNAKPPQPLVECLADADQLLTHLPMGVTVKIHVSPGSPSTILQTVSHEIPVVNQNPGAIATLDTIVTHNNPAPGQHVIVHNGEMQVSSFEPLLASPSNRNQYQLPSFPFDMDQLHTLQPSPNSGDFEMGDWDTISMPSPGFWDRLNRPLSPGAFLQSPQFPDPARQNGSWFAGPNFTSPTNVAPSDRAHNLGPIESARLLLTGSSSMTARRQWHCSNEMSPTAEELLDRLQSLMVINAADGYFFDALSVVVGTGVFTDQFIQILLFSIVNDFAGLEGTPVEFVIKFINEQEPARSGVLRYLKNGTSTVYSRALAEKLLKAAITAGDAKTVHDLLALKIVRPDDIVYVHYDSSSGCERTTAIEEAATMRQLDIVQLLVHFDADVNKTYKPSWYRAEKGALECAIGLWGEYRPADIRLVDFLLNNGATVNGRLMSAALRWGDATLVEKLMSSISSSEHEYFFTERSLSDAAEYLKNDISYKFVRQIMQACQEIHNNACLATNAAVLVRTITEAARRNNLDLVNLLLPHGGQRGLDNALTGAARFGSHSLVRFLIARGASVNGEPRYFEGELSDTTPLASAIRHKDDELIDILAKEGAWDQIEEPGRLKAVMIAIAESGNLAYLRQALRLVPSPSREALGDPLFFFAIKACHEEIALALLEAGAHVVREPERDPLLEALRTKSLSITWAILECELPIEYVMDEFVLEAAIAWGDLEIVKALFFLGNGVNNYWGRPPLSFAIKAGNRPLIDCLINLGADLSINPARKSVSYARRGSFVLVDGRRTFVRDGSERFSSPLAAAVLVRDDATANYLLDHGADPADEQAIINAIIRDRGMLDLILQTFQQQYPRGRGGFGGRVLIHTLSTRDEGALDLCLRAGFDVNNMTFDEELGMVTALGFAIRKHHSRHDTIYKLLSAGGDSNLPASMEGGVWEGIPDPDKRITARRTAFLDAVETKDLSLLELLISRGAEVDKEAKLGLKRTPLQKACEIGSHAIVDLLLRHKADVNAAPAIRGGATALQLAAKTGSLRMAKKLLDHGAKVDAPGARVRGRSAIEYAAEYGRLDMIPLLVNAAGGKLPAGQVKSAIGLSRANGHSACVGFLAELSTRNQAFLHASSTAENGGMANVVS